MCFAMERLQCLLAPHPLHWEWCEASLLNMKSCASSPDEIWHLWAAMIRSTFLCVLLLQCLLRLPVALSCSSCCLLFKPKLCCSQLSQLLLCQKAAVLSKQSSHNSWTSCLFLFQASCSMCWAHFLAIHFSSSAHGLLSFLSPNIPHKFASFFC